MMPAISRASLVAFLNRIDSQIALRNGIGAALAWLAAGAFASFLPHPNPMISEMWCVLTTLLVLQAHLGGTYRAAWMRFLGLVIGSLFGGILATFFGADPLTLALSVAGTVIICSLFRLQEAYRIAVSSVAVIVILMPVNTNLITPWEFSLYRFLDSCIGIIVAMFVAHTILPYKARDQLKGNMSDAVASLGRLYRLVTYGEEQNENQKRAILMLIKDIDALLYQNRQILEDSKAELITKSARVNDWSLLISQLDTLFEQVLSMRHVYRPDTKKIFDEELNSHFNQVVEKISSSFEDVSGMLKTGKWITCLPDLGLSLTQLKEELSRFRGRKDSRESNLEDVESFFVFFYSLKSILELLKRTEATIHTLISEKSF